MHALQYPCNIFVGLLLLKLPLYVDRESVNKELSSVLNPSGMQSRAFSLLLGICLELILLKLERREAVGVTAAHSASFFGLCSLLNELQLWPALQLSLDQLSMPQRKKSPPSAKGTLRRKQWRILVYAIFFSSWTSKLCILTSWNFKKLFVYWLISGFLLFRHLKG